MGSPAHRLGLTSWGQSGGGAGALVPCSICSVKFVKCKESLNSCIFKEKSYLTLCVLDLLTQPRARF